jgi:acetoin utilization deacetylase AcuC-like enzyme
VLHVVHHPDYVGPAIAGTAFPHDKYGMVMLALAQSEALVSRYEPEVMPRAWLEAVHDPAYVDQVLSCTVPPEKEKRIGYPVSAHVSRRSQLSVGGTWLAARLALEQGYAANSAGGSHHALAQTGAGYCIFNDLAVAAHRLLAERTVRRIMILDLDVHQGDGTASRQGGAISSPSRFTPSIISRRRRLARHWTSVCRMEPVITLISPHLKMRSCRRWTCSGPI